MPKVKDKDRILKAAREKQLVIYKGAPIRLSADFSTEALKKYSKYWQAMTYNQDYSILQQSYHLESKGILNTVKGFSDKVKLKEFIVTKPLYYETLKGLI